MKTIIIPEKHINVFTFSELSKKSKQKAIENKIQENSDPHEINFMLEHQVEYYQELVLKDHGFDNTKKACWNLHDQGEGACFEPEIYDMEVLINNIAMCNPNFQTRFFRIKKWLDYDLCEISRALTNTRYTHEKTYRIELITGQSCPTRCPVVENTIYDFNVLLSHYYQSICRHLHKLIDSEYDYQVSEKNAIECLKESEDENFYTEDGMQYDLYLND